MEITKFFTYKKRIFIVVFIFLSLSVGNYLYLINSEHFNYFVDSIKSNKEFVDRHGSVVDVEMSFVGYKFKIIGDDSGSAKFNSTIETSKTKVDVYVELQKRNGKWSVVLMVER